MGRPRNPSKSSLRSLDRQSVDRQSVDRQSVDRQSVDRQSVDRQSVDGGGDRPSRVDSTVNVAGATMANLGNV